MISLSTASVKFRGYNIHSEWNLKRLNPFLIESLILTVFDMSKDCSVLHGDVHVEVLDGDVELTDAFLVLLASDVQFVAHLF